MDIFEWGSLKALVARVMTVDLGRVWGSGGIWGGFGLSILGALGVNLSLLGHWPPDTTIPVSGGEG